MVPAAEKNIFNLYQGNDYKVLRKDGIAHIVELPHATTAFSIFEKNMDVNHPILHSSNTPILMMGRQSADTLTITVVNPFLNYRYHDPVALKPNTLSQVILRLHGKWKLTNNANGKISYIEKKLLSELPIETKDGLPVDSEIQRIP